MSLYVGCKIINSSRNVPKCPPRVKIKCQITTKQGPSYEFNDTIKERHINLQGTKRKRFRPAQDDK